MTYISRATSKLSVDREEEEEEEEEEEKFRGSGVAWSGAAPFGWTESSSSCR